MPAPRSKKQMIDDSQQAARTTIECEPNRRPRTPHCRMGSRAKILALCVLAPLAVSPVFAADKVSVATVGNSSDAGFFIADANGHFRAENLEVTFIPFDTA